MKNNVTNPAKTVLTISTGFILVFLITGWNLAVIVAFIIGLAGVLSTYLSKQIDFLWMKLAQVLELIVPKILLGIVFYLFLFPISVLARLFGKKDPLYLKNRNESMFIDSNKQFDKKSFEKTW